MEGWAVGRDASLANQGVKTDVKVAKDDDEMEGASRGGLLKLDCKETDDSPLDEVCI